MRLKVFVGVVFLTFFKLPFQNCSFTNTCEFFIALKLAIQINSVTRTNVIMQKRQSIASLRSSFLLFR